MNATRYNAHAAVKRAAEQMAERSISWNPIFADVIRVDGPSHKIGHIVSDGHSNTRWKFVPTDKLRRMRKATPADASNGDNALAAVTLPKWCYPFLFGPFQTYQEIGAIFRRDPDREGCEPKPAA